MRGIAYRKPRDSPCWDCWSACQVQLDQKLREDRLRVARCTRLQIGKDVPIKLHSQLHSVLVEEERKKEKWRKETQSTKFLGRSFWSFLLFKPRDFFERHQAKWIMEQRNMYPSVTSHWLVVPSVSWSLAQSVLTTCPWKVMTVAKWGVLLAKPLLENHFPEKHTHLLQENANLR